MTSESRERLAVLVEKRLAGLISPAETGELSKFLETSEEARELYLRAVEFHLDLGAASAPAPAEKAAARIGGSLPRGGRGLPSSGDAIAADPRYQRWGVGVGIAAVAAGFLLVAALLPMWWGSSETRESKSVGLPGLRSGTGGDQPMHFPDAPPPPPPSPLSVSMARVEELRRGVFANVWLINMSTLLSESMRYRNLTTEWAQLQADIANCDSRIKYNLQELAKVGEKVALENHLAPGDQILGFANRDLTRMKPGEAAAVLQTWISSWRAGPALEQVNIIRGEKKMTIYLEFPEETKELLALLRHPALAAEGNPGGIAVKEMIAMPEELVGAILREFDALPPGYRSFLLPQEHRRMQVLLMAKRALPEDIEWLKIRILGEVIPSFQREAANIRSQVLALEPKLKENVASDVITRKNGTKFEGQILQETPESIKIKGLYGSVTIPRDDIQKVEKGKGAALEFPARYAEASRREKPAEKLEKLTTLLAWCVEKNLKIQKEYVAYVILTLDASNDRARNAMGLARPAISGGSLPVPPK